MYSDYPKYLPMKTRYRFKDWIRINRYEVVFSSLLLIGSLNIIPFATLITIPWLIAVFCIFLLAELQRVPRLLLLAASSSFFLPLGSSEGFSFVYIATVLAYARWGLQMFEGNNNKVIRIKRVSLRNIATILFAFVCVFLITILKNTFELEAYSRPIIIFSILLLGLLVPCRFEQLVDAAIFAATLVTIQMVLQFLGFVEGIFTDQQTFFTLEFGAFMGAQAGGLIGLGILFILFYPRLKLSTCLVLLIILTGGLLLNGKRTWILALAASALSLILIEILNKKRKLLQKIHFFCILFGTTIGLFLAFYIKLDVVMQIVETFRKNMETGRFRKWESALDQLQESPLLGLGAEGIDLSDYFHGMSEAGTRGADSLYINTLAQFGVIGSSALIASGAILMILVWIAIRNKGDWLNKRMWIGYIAFWLVAGIFWDPTMFVPSAVINSLIITCFLNLETGKKTSTFRKLSGVNG